MKEIILASASPRRKELLEKLGFKFTVELNSVNRKQNDISINLPKELVGLEPRIRDAINAKLSRGRINVVVAYHRGTAKAEEQTSGKGGKKQYDNTNRGVLFLNNKDGNEQRPDYQGFADIELPEGSIAGDVVSFRLAGWIKTPKAGGDDFGGMARMRPHAA